MICTKSVEYSVEKLHSLPKKSCHLPRWEYTRVYVLELLLCEIEYLVVKSEVKCEFVCPRLLMIE